MIKYNENDINYLKIIMEKAKLDKLYLKIIITYDDYVYFKFRDKNIHEAR